MRETERLAAEIDAAVDGDPWYGSSLTAVLDGVDARTAATRPPGGGHCIWEIVLHVTSWARYVAYRLEGGAPSEPVDGDWPAIRSYDGAEWELAVAGMRSAHADLATVLSGLATDELDAVTAETPMDSQGSPVTLYRISSGIAQHDAYHVGQIAVLKRVLAAKPDAAS